MSFDLNQNIDLASDNSEVAALEPIDSSQIPLESEFDSIIDTLISEGFAEEDINFIDEFLTTLDGFEDLGSAVDLEITDLIVSTIQDCINSSEDANEIQRRVNTFLVILLIDNSSIALTESQQNWINEVINTNSDLQFYVAQKELMQEMGSSIVYFDFSIEEGMVPNQNFSTLSDQEQNSLVDLIDSYRIKRSLQQLLQNYDLPPELQSFYAASNRIYNGYYQESLPVINRLLLSNAIAEQVSDLNEPLRSVIDNLGLNIDSIDQQLLDLRRICLLDRLNDLEGLLLSASPNRGMALHSAASTMNPFHTSRGLFYEYTGDSQINNISEQFLAVLREGLENNMTWE
ncbi:MAG: hypothetical protein KDC90_17435, partial [Ignavibacteriae bacterium]|nr:hypothetical protein [Ignavibacteriota bacterium]